MLLRTHFVITLFFVLIILPLVDDKIIFISVALIATLLPDIDTRFSKIGKIKIFRPLQLFFNHRGVLHSFTFLFLLSLIFTIFVPILVLPFFIGYGLHLLADSFTHQGIKAFYPINTVYSGRFKTGGTIEFILFLSLIMIDVLLIFNFFDIF